MRHYDERRAHLAQKSDDELRDIVSAERVVPLDHEIAEIAQQVLDERPANPCWRMGGEAACATVSPSEPRWRWLDRCPGCGSTDCGCLARRVPIGPQGGNQ